MYLDNSKLGFIKLEQEAKRLPDYGTDLDNPDFAAFVRACGGVGFNVSEAGDLEKALEDALAPGKPAVVDIKVDPDALILPPKITPSQTVSFGLAKIREAFGA